MQTTSSTTKTFERNVEGRRYTVRYIEPMYEKEEERIKNHQGVSRQLYEIFAKYYGNQENKKM